MVPYALSRLRANCAVRAHYDYIGKSDWGFLLLLSANCGLLYAVWSETLCIYMNAKCEKSATVILYAMWLSILAAMPAFLSIISKMEFVKAFQTKVAQYKNIWQSFKVYIGTYILLVRWILHALLIGEWFAFVRMKCIHAPHLNETQRNVICTNGKVWKNVLSW